MFWGCKLKLNSNSTYELKCDEDCTEKLIHISQATLYSSKDAKDAKDAKVAKDKGINII